MEEDFLRDKVDLETTLNAFSRRLNDKKQQREIQNQKSLHEEFSRHKRMLNAIGSIRKSLIEMTRIELEFKYKLQMVQDDYLGWPRISVKLINLLDPTKELHALTVIANDRNGTGNIEISYRKNEKSIIISVKESSNLSKLPSLIKRATRLYLEDIEEIVLNKYKKEENEDIDLLTKEEKKAKASIDENLFTEDNKNFLDTLPKIEELEELPLDIDYLKED